MPPLKSDANLQVTRGVSGAYRLTGRADSIAVGDVVAS